MRGMCAFGSAASATSGPRKVSCLRFVAIANSKLLRRMWVGEHVTLQGSACVHEHEALAACGQRGGGVGVHGEGAGALLHPCP